MNLNMSTRLGFREHSLNWTKVKGDVSLGGVARLVNWASGVPQQMPTNSDVRAKKDILSP